MYPNISVGMNYGLSVPYQTQISPSLSSGTQIHVSGTATGSRFEINLKDYQNSIVLHVNPRFDDNALVLNSSQQGSWGQEERYALPFYRGVRFTMVILATDRSFKIAVNNTHICEFYQRTSMYVAQLVEVKGDINLESVQVYSGSGSMNFPPTMGGDFAYCPPPQQPAFGGDFNVGFGFPSAPPPPFTGGSVPAIHSCRIYTGSRIFVRGFIHPGANRFELNLSQGYSDNDDIAFHFNPRFDTRIIVKNHRQNGQWGQEENQPFPSYMPLMPGSPIDLEIACNMDKYMVFMNNHLIAEYYHKISPGAVMSLICKGDITVNSVGQL